MARKQMTRDDSRDEERAAVMAAIAQARAALDRAERLITRDRKRPKSTAALSDEEAYPPGEQEYDRRILEEADRERAAGNEVLIPAFVADLELEGSHPVQAWRRYRRMSQAKLAKAAGIGLATLARIEGRNVATPQDATLDKLAKALDAPVLALVEDEE